MKSKLKKKPKSKIMEHGYINIYSRLSAQEKRQVFYKRLYKSQNPQWDESLIYLTNKFKEFLDEDVKVLDIGCGNGNYCIDENRTNISWAVGIDIDKKATEKNQCLDKIVYGNINSLPFEDKSFEIVISLWGLEHFENPGTVFNEVHRVLKDGGVFLFATPNHNYFPLRIVDFLGTSKLNYFINKFLYGRDQKDVFKTYYRANSVHLLKNLSKGLFSEVELKLNYDPSYTSFDKLSYNLTNILYFVFGRFSIMSPHIIGILRKVETKGQ